jgi:hypothetical protein
MKIMPELIQILSPFGWAAGTNAVLSFCGDKISGDVLCFRTLGSPRQIPQGESESRERSTGCGTTIHCSLKISYHIIILRKGSKFPAKIFISGRRYRFFLYFRVKILYGKLFMGTVNCSLKALGEMILAISVISEFFMKS